MNGFAAQNMNNPLKATRSNAGELESFCWKGPHPTAPGLKSHCREQADIYLPPPLISAPNFILQT